jgi:putative FmdB family regulatory protein
MPIYEYRCVKCNQQFETLVLGSNSEVTCPHCKGDQLKRLLSACGFKSSGAFNPSSDSSGCTSCSGGSCSSCH